MCSTFKLVQLFWPTLAVFGPVMGSFIYVKLKSLLVKVTPLFVFWHRSQRANDF